MHLYVSAFCEGVESGGMTVCDHCTISNSVSHFLHGPSSLDIAKAAV